MSRIHYFQRYSNPENVVTNNTLQLLARIYDYSTAAASRFLTDITGEPIEIGIEVAQQERVGNAIPDGAIIQRSFKVLLEAKVGAGVSADQLIRHAGTFSGESQKILLLLTKQSVGRDEEAIAAQIRALHPDVIFKNVTYETICEVVQRLFKEHESNMRALVDDYVEYCNDANLFDQSKFLLRIVPCGQSVRINKMYGIYFHPSDRGYSRHAFVGIYAGKTVQSLLAVKSVFDIHLDGNNLTKTLIEGEDTNEFDDRLRGIVIAAKEECGYEIANGHRFWCGQTFETDFQKSSPGGIQGARFMNLRDLLGTFADARDVATRLRSMTWD